MALATSDLKKNVTFLSSKIWILLIFVPTVPRPVSMINFCWTALFYTMYLDVRGSACAGMDQCQDQRPVNESCPD